MLPISCFHLLISNLWDPTSHFENSTACILVRTSHLPPPTLASSLTSLKGAMRRALRYMYSPLCIRFLPPDSCLPAPDCGIPLLPSASALTSSHRARCGAPSATSILPLSWITASLRYIPASLLTSSHKARCGALCATSILLLAHGSCLPIFFTFPAYGRTAQILASLLLPPYVGLLPPYAYLLPPCGYLIFASATSCFLRLAAYHLPFAATSLRQELPPGASAKKSHMQNITTRQLYGYIHLIYIYIYIFMYIYIHIYIYIYICIIYIYMWADRYRAPL